MGSDTKIEVGEAPRTVVPHIGLFSGVAMITGFVIGAGIFGSPGPVYANVCGVGGALMIWLLGGVLCGLGAFSYAELGTMWMENGGDHVYLNHAFGRYASLSFSWTTALLGLPLCSSTIAAICGNYIAMLFYYKPGMVAGDVADQIPGWLSKVLAMSIVIFAGCMNMLSPRVGTLIQNVCTVAKLAALTMIAIIGFIYLGKGRTENFQNSFAVTSSVGESNPIGFAKALLFALFPCGGFQNLNYVTGEVKNPKRNLPLAIAISVVIITGIYLLANVAYFAVLPLSVVETSKYVAIELGIEVFGPIGAYIMCMFVGLSSLGAVNGTLYSNSRLVAAAAEDGVLLPKPFAKIHPTRGTPILALILTMVIPCLLLIPDEGFTLLAPMYSFTTWSFYALTVTALLYLRRKYPNMSRPFRVFTPIPMIFVVACVPVLAMLFYEPDASKFLRTIVPNIAALAFMIIPPYIIYYFKVVRAEKKAKEECPCSSRMI